MKRFLLLSLALAGMPLAAAAQAAPPNGSSLNPQQQSALQHVHVEVQQYRLQARTRLLAALTPAHRGAVANIVGQLALSAQPNWRAAAQSLDALLTPAERESVVTIAAAERSNLRALAQQQRSIVSATLSADERARIAARAAQRQAFRQSHPRTAHVADPGSIVLRTLSGGAGGGWRGRMM